MARSAYCAGFAPTYQRCAVGRITASPNPPYGDTLRSRRSFSQNASRLPDLPLEATLRRVVKFLPAERLRKIVLA